MDANTLYQQWQDYFSQGGSLGQLRHLSRAELDILYRYAYQLYGQGQVVKAKKCFYLLVALDHNQFDYLLSLAFCYQHLAEHQEAIEYFSYAALSRINDPRPPYFCGISYYALGELSKATEAFQAAVNWSLASPKWFAIKKAAEQQLAAITLRRA